VGALKSKTASIVVVDDYEDMRTFLKDALEGAGYDVRSASEGGHALSLLRQRGADLLITDIFMPGREGFETIQACKSEFPQTTIVAISGAALPGLKHDFLASASLVGVDATLRKPFDVDQLLDTVRTVLRAR
jgi:CheY-like chemotaxis protein